jgi:hypothetical protein
MQTFNRWLTASTRNLILLVSLISLSGCTTPLQVENLQPSKEHRQFVKNYTIGQPMTVNVGEPLIKFQDYWLEDSESSVAIPNQSVTLHGGIVSITLVAGQKYPVRGKMMHEGMEYTVVEAVADSRGYRAVLVRSDGSLYNRVATYLSINRALVVVVYSMNISDPSTRMVRETSQNIKTTKGYENFELLYTGTNSNAINITYREFSPDGLARVAFFQNLTYEATAKIITFKKFRIQVERASSESITFTVLTDGT